MTTKLLFYIIVLSVFTLGTSRVEASDWSRLADFEGRWYFSIGDNPDWAKENVDMSNWDRIYVPENWDNYYDGYNGYGWYRKTFDINWLPDEGDLVVFLGQIDDVDEVFINGVKVGQSGEFPPEFKTAYNFERRYYIPKGLIRKSNNVIAVRVYDTGGRGGIYGTDKIGIFFDEDYHLLAQDLSGTWKFSIHRDGDVYSPKFNDSHWDDLKVPGRWDDQGYADFDGTAWYRTKFTVNSDLMSRDDLYLVLGKIDDFDKVYLNGEQFARTEYLDDYSRYNKGNAWRLYRVYKLPKSDLKKENVLVVEVRDDVANGGIYEGPIGIMTERNAKVILDREEEYFWENPVRFFLRHFDF